MARVCTYHVLLVGQDGGVDSTGAAEGQVLAHALLHVGQELLGKGDRDTESGRTDPSSVGSMAQESRAA